jgi:hypothetical protein
MQMPCILNLGTWWRWLVSFTSQPINTQDSLKRKLDRPSWSFGEKENFLPLSWLEPQMLIRPARSLVTVPSEVSPSADVGYYFSAVFVFQRCSVCELPCRRRGKKRVGGGVSVTARFLLYCQAVHPTTVSCALLSLHCTSYFVGIVCCQLERELIKPRDVFTLWRKRETESDE